jgi:PAS domain S-box-containing protein
MPRKSNPRSLLGRWRENDARYRALFRAARDAIFIMRGDRFVAWNPRTLVMFGCRDGDLAGKSPVDFSPQLQPDGVSSSDKAARLIDAALAGDCPRFDWLHRRLDGTDFDAEVSLNRLDLDEGPFLLAIVRDETERIASRRALEASERRLALAMEVARAGVWELELPSLRATIDASTLAALGWKQPPPTLEDWKRLWHPEDVAGAVAGLEEFIESRGDTLVHEFRVRDKDGRWNWIETLGRVVERDAEGRAVRLIGAHINTTARKEAEEEARRQQQMLLQADKLASIGLMLSGIAHEINNPNNLIMLSADVMGTLWPTIRAELESAAAARPHEDRAPSEVPDAIRQFTTLLGHVASGSVRIQKIVQSMKDFARVDSGQLAPGLDLRQVIDAAVLLANSIVRKSTDRFSVVHGDVPPIVGNAQKLEQVVINLISNACHSLPDRSRPVEVRTSLRDDPPRVAIEVRDGGCGIPADVLPKVFDPFFTTKRDSGGTGLGLSVSYGIVKEHGGEIVFESEPGIGTRATVLLPIAPPAPEAER